ncbi:MAG: preprotein translocase subunit SecG [Rhodobacteraceae bacterium]|nr:preprotein translocase subunit SecG [Paracoccaceae bacterium]
MENVILVILLILALCLIGVVLIQRSEGGGLGIGGGGGGVVSGRGAASALGRVTWFLGAAFMSMCIIMTILAAKNAADNSVIDRLGSEAPAAEDGAAPALPAGDLLPPTSDEPLTPRAD